MSNAPAPTKRRRQLHTRGNISPSSSRDASEEDNDDLTDDTQSIRSLAPTSSPSSPNPALGRAHHHSQGHHPGGHNQAPSPLSGSVGGGGVVGRPVGGVKRGGSFNNAAADGSIGSTSQGLASGQITSTSQPQASSQALSDQAVQAQTSGSQGRVQENATSHDGSSVEAVTLGGGQGSGSEGGGETDPTYDADAEITKPGNSLALAASAQHQPHPTTHTSHLSSTSTSSTTTEEGEGSPALTPGPGLANIAASGGGAGKEGQVARAVTPTPGSTGRAAGRAEPGHVGVGIDPPSGMQDASAQGHHSEGGFKVPALPHPPPASAFANLSLLDPTSSPDIHAPTQSHRSHPKAHTLKPKSSDLGPPKMMTRPKMIEVEDIRRWVRRAIEGRGKEDGIERAWRTNEPPVGRKVRIYADGVYDLFHFGHALQLRQAKLSFENVHLIVGVNSDEQCAAHKNAPSMTHAERMESVSNCKWADEIAPDAPWIVTQDFVDRYEIDYVAHDEEVYPGAGVEDVYAFAKKQGKFIPTRRTPSISTSDLLERIVRGYRDGFFDSKLIKNNAPELIASDVDWDSSGEFERRGAREKRNALRAAANAVVKVESDESD